MRMDLGNPTPSRQAAQRHRRSDRYLVPEQAPAAQQAAMPAPVQPGPSPSPQKHAPVPPQQASRRTSSPQAQPLRQMPAQQQQNMGQPLYPQQTMSQTVHPQQAQEMMGQTVHPQQTQQMMAQTLYPQQTQQVMGQTLYPQQTQQIMGQPIHAQQAMGQALYPQQNPPFTGNTMPPHQPGYVQQALGNTMPPPRQPGQVGYYGQPQEPWQQPYYGQPGYDPARFAMEDDGSGDAPGPMRQSRGQRVRMLDAPGGFPWRAVAALLVLVAVLVAAGLGIRSALRDRQVRNYVSAYDTRFCEGVYVDGIHLGGMTQQEGINAVTAQAQQRNSDWYVRLTYQGRTVIEMNASHLGMRADVADALRRAWEQGHASNDAYARQEAMLKLQEEPYQDYTALPSGDTSVVDSVLENLRNQVYRAPQDAYLAEFDPDKTYPFTIVDEVAGMMLNTDSLKERIYEMVSTMASGELEIEPEAIAPNVTAAQIRESVALRADEYTEISTTSTDERNKNIKRAFEKISGTIVKPGDVFSFNAVVGRRTEANGFFPAVEYQYGNEVMGIGGGVCQASTSLYLAAVAANLQITKHTPHAMQVGYTTFGKDATVSWEGDRQVDFAFRNNTDGNIYIVASVQYDRSISKYSIARVRIYGPSLGDGVTYKLVAEEIEFLPRTEEIKKDTKGEYPELVYTDDQKVVSEGRDGHVTQSYRVKYQNGVEVERTNLFTDTYKPSPRVIYTGTQERWVY